METTLRVKTQSAEECEITSHRLAFSRNKTRLNEREDMKRSMLCLVWMFCFKTNSSLWVFFKSLNLEECWEERCQVWYLQQETCLQTSERRRRTPAHIVSGIIQRSGAASLTASRRRHWVQWAYFTLSPQLTGFLTSCFPSWCVRKSFYLSWFEFFDNKPWRSSPNFQLWQKQQTWFVVSPDGNCVEPIFWSWN